MPELTEEYKRKRLVDLGIDPNQTSYEEYFSGDFPSTSNAPQAPANNSNTLGALGTGARKSIGSTVGGVGATAAALALFPEPTGATKLAALALALGSGLAGAYAGGKAQEKLEPIIRGEDEQATQARLAKEAQLAEDNQIASFVGEQLPSAAFFRPSITGIKNAVKGAANVGRLSGIELSAAQKAALSNTAVNAGIGGGVSVASDLVDDNEVSIPRALAHAGVGALMNEPTRIGQRLGFHSSLQEQDFSNASTEVPLIKRIKDPNRMLPAPAVKGEDVIIPPYEGTDLQKKTDFAKAKVEQTFDANSAKNTDAVTEAKPVSQNTLNITKPALERSILENQIPRVTVKDSTLPDNTGNIEKANAEINTPLTEAERIQEDYDKGRKFQEVTSDKDKVINTSEPKTFTISKETAALLAKRGIKATAGEVYLQNNDGTYKVDANGKFIRARGSASAPPYRDIKLDFEHATVDTPYHEAAHIHYPEANENTIEQVGKEYVDRLPEGEMKKFFKDLLGSKARKMAAKLHEDAPYNETVGNPNVNVEDGIRNQDIDAKTQAYNQKYSKLLQLMREGKLESQEGKLAWKDFEDYKNTHFAGNTPEGYSNKVKQGTVNKYQPIKDFELSTEREIRKERPFNLVIAEDGTIPTQNLLGRLRSSSQISKGELHALEESGLKEYLKDKARIDVGELQDWIKENGPRVEVRKAGDNVLTPERKRLNELEHKLDTLGYTFDITDTGAIVGLKLNGQKIYAQDIHPDAKSEFKEFAQLVMDSKRNNTDNKANWSMVGPLEKMPGYVEIAAVKPHMQDKRGNAKFQSSHSFPPNTIAWVRGFVETLPNGEKVFRIIELQSDWAQQYRKQQEQISERKAAGLNTAGERDMSDPLLDYYESIALKAAIKHAREQGINKIAIDDAETAMLTEGHDRAARRTRIDANGREVSAVEQLDPRLKTTEKIDISQEKGMRQHYDTSIPNILRKLTGDIKGERVEFGEHKMAFDTEYGHVPNTGERRIQSMKERPDLIFKNPNGTPKTTSTSRIFDISNVLVEKSAEPYRSTFYQRIDNTGTPEVDNYNPGTPRKDIDGRSIGKRILDRINPLNITKGLVQNIHEIDTQHGPVLAEAFVKERRGMTNYEGQFRDSVDTFTGIRNEGERDLLYRVLLAENEHQKYFKSVLPESLHDQYDQVRQTLKDMVSEQNANGEKVKDWVKNADGKWETVMRPRKANDFYFPNMVSGDVVEALAKPDSNIARKLKADLIAHYEKHYGEGFGKKLGEEAFQDFTSNDGRGGDSVKFGPNRKAEGIGLPESWIEPNPISSMRRYLRRTANDLSFFKHIENDPKVARMAGIDKNQDNVPNPKDVPDLHNIPAVQNVLDIITGRAFSKSPVLDAASGIANSLLLGPISGLADLVSVPFNAIKFAPSIFDVPGVIVGGIKNFRKGLANSYETGFNKKDPLFLRDLTLPTTRLEQKLYVLRDAIYKIQGRKALEQYSRGLSQSMMEYVVEVNAAKAKNGDKNAQAFLNKLLGSKVDYNNIDIKKAGSAAAELIQGTYDFRNLPMWAIDSNIAPFFRLARWNIEQLNTFGKHVWEPAKSGNLTPLILSTFGAVAGGAIIKQMRESTSDKKAYTATFNEIINSEKGAEGNLPLIAYKLIALSSYVGYAGIASDLARSALDVMMLKNKPQSIDYPFWGLIEDSTTKVMQAVSAIKDGEGDVVDVGSKLASDLLKDNMQLARLANTWLLENTGLNDNGLDKREKGDKLRDLRVFKQVEGLPVSPMSESNVNPYANQDIREFKQTADIDKARKLAPVITKKALAEPTYTGKVQKLEGIRKNQYATVPSPTANPSEFASYVQYIRRTQGEDAVKKLLADYNKRNAINRIKRDMIPSLHQ